MQQAAAMAYGGELVDAADCTANDFKTLIPLCPNCKEPVYLVESITRKPRKPNGKPVQVKAHWSHFPAVNRETAAACEVRVKGYTSRQRQKIATQASQQRLRWLKRWFWQVYCEQHKTMFGKKAGTDEHWGIPDAVESAKDLLWRDSAPRVMEGLELGRKDAQSTRDYHVIIDSCGMSLFDGNVPCFPCDHSITKEAASDRNSFPIYSGLCTEEKVKALGNQKWHSKLVYEVLDFLHSDMNQEIWTELMVLGILGVSHWADKYDWRPPIFSAYRNGDWMVVEFDEDPSIEDMSWFYNVLMGHFFVSIFMIPWAAEFQKLEAQVKAA